MKAVFLIIDYVPHQLLTIKNLIEKNHAEVYAYHVGRFNKSVPKFENFKTTAFKTLDKRIILEQIQEINPDIVVVAGWMIPDYVWVAKRLKQKLSIPIVSYSDTQWYGTTRQKINAFISPFHVRKAFTHIWVAGIYQFEYARRLGFNKEKIIFNSLTADTKLFETIAIEKKEEDYPKNFIYIGRFAEEKGLKYLITAWEKIKFKNNWTLTLVGDGELKSEFSSCKNVIIKDHMSQEDLLHEMQNAGCFVLPSIHEPWALVIHEAAAAGLPIICTETCGAAPHFVINNYNGKIIKPKSSNSLQTAMEEIMNMTSSELIDFSAKSRLLSTSINPEISIQCLKNTLL